MMEKGMNNASGFSVLIRDGAVPRLYVAESRLKALILAPVPATAPVWPECLPLRGLSF